jgi:hypothetical protein
MNGPNRSGFYRWLRDILISAIIVPNGLLAVNAPPATMIIAGIICLICLQAWERLPELHSFFWDQKMIAFAGMVTFGMAFCVCSAWYFWPSNRSIDYRSREPLQKFDDAGDWSVSFQLIGLVSGGFSQDKKSPFYVALQRCEFINLSVKQERIIDLKIVIPTKDPALPTLSLNTATMEFQSYRQNLKNHGIDVGPEALGRNNALLENPIMLAPSQRIEGAVEFDINDADVRHVFLQHSPDFLGWLKIADATVYVTERRSGKTKVIKIGRRYDATSGTVRAADTE